MDNRRTTIVINKPFQYQHSLMIVALAVLLVNGFLIVRMLFPGDAPLALSASAILGIGLAEITLVALIWYGSLKASHRIAGPVFVFTRAVTRLCQGDLTTAIELRDNDMFQAEAREMNSSFAALRARIAAVQQLVSQVRQEHAAGGDIGATLDRLNAELAAFSLDANKR